MYNGMKKAGFYHFTVCIASSMMIFCCMGMVNAAFSVHFPYMVEVAGLSQTQTSLLLTLRFLATTVGLFIINRLLMRIGIRKTVLLAMLLAAMGYILYAASVTFTGYAVASCLHGLCYAFGGDVTSSLLAMRWFESRRGFAIGLASFGSGVAIIVMPLLVAHIAENMSIQAAFIAECGMCLGVCAVTFAIIRDRPEYMGLQPYKTDKNVKAAVQRERQRTAGNGILAALCISSALFGLTANGMVGNFSLHYVLSGIGLNVVPYLISTYGITIAIGKIFVGLLADLIGTLRVALISGILLLIGGVLCSTLVITHSSILAYIGAFILGLGYPIGFIGMSLNARDLAAPGDFTRVLKSFKLFYTLGATAFGPIPGILADQFGNYGFAYALMTGLNVVAVLIIVVAYRRDKV